ncbi:acetyltransferase [Vibrio cholerae]|nr:acetyltransferase [Vibrio cholerae]
MLCLSLVVMRWQPLRRALGQLGGIVWILNRKSFGLKLMKFATRHLCLGAICCLEVWRIMHMS